jgi:hypothetical protein
MTQPDPSAPSGALDQPGAPSGAAGGDGTTPSTTDAGAAQSGGTTTEQETAATVSKADFDRVVNQLRAADQNRSKTEAELRQLRDKDLPELDRLKRDNEAATVQINQLKERVQRQALENAFLKENSIKWIDPEAALQLADMADVTIGDDGTVTGLKIAMDKLAKAKPYLVDKGTPPAETPPAKKTASGVPPMNGQSGTNKADTSGLASRIPALRSRRTASS